MDADWGQELAQAQIEIKGLDRSYAMLYLARMDAAANQAIATLPRDAPPVSGVYVDLPNLLQGAAR